MPLLPGSFARVRVALFAACCVLPSGLAPAAERWFVAPLSSIEWTDGKPSSLATDPWRLQNSIWNSPALISAARLDGDGEAYLVSATDDAGGVAGGLSIVARTSADGDLTGRVIGPSDDGRAATSSAFRVPGAAAATDSQLALFLRGKAEHYERLASADLPGRPWFAHQGREARAAIAALSGKDAPPAAEPTPAPQRFDDENGLDATFATFSGARALAENLQWDRALRLSTQQDGTVALDTIAGITTRAFDWKPLVKDLKPEVDPLAELIPDDQYVVLCPTFDAYLGLADELERRASPLVDLFSARATKGLPREKYERQLGLGLSALTRLFGDRFVKSVAMTGADVDFESGTDIALLFESENPDGLLAVLRAKLELAAAGAAKDVERGSGQSRPDQQPAASWTSFRTADRSLCSYLARVGSTIVVTNSQAELDAIVQAASGGRGSLAKLDEYRFFRDRYPRGAGENALVLLSDPTIRRWCSPKWRIGSSRRARACQELAELHARVVDHGALSEADARAQAALAATYGSFDFVTPAVELGIDRVTQAEADAYARFRNAYQSRWSTYFDPIALRIAIDGTALDTDLTVMPLIAGSEFKEFADVTSGVELKAGDGDPHPESIAHYVQAINPQSEIFKTGQGMFESMTGEIDVNPIGWIGNHFSVYFDDGAIWDELAQSKKDDSAFEHLLESRMNEIPVAFEVGVKDALGCAAFLTFLRTYANDSAPGLVRFETKKHGEDAYVQVSGDFGAGTDEQGNPVEHHLFYCVTSRKLTVSLNEALILRAIDRKNAAAPPAAPGAKSLTLELKQRVLESLVRLFHDDIRHQRQAAAWGALPILNEWKRLFPNEDPVQVHQRLWGETIADPYGGTFRWNESLKTMESSTCGNPLAPQDDAVEKSYTESFTTVRFGLTFEHDGLRAHMRIEK